jgi:DNA-directed RNA polymerase specialized sigma24 family protein
MGMATSRVHLDDRSRPDQTNDATSGGRQTRIDQLEPRDREVLMRRHWQEQPQEQICRELSISENEYRLVNVRAKALLRMLLAGDQPEAGT